jgi:hypothetical protein
VALNVFSSDLDSIRCRLNDGKEIKTEYQNILVVGLNLVINMIILSEVSIKTNFNHILLRFTMILNYVHLKLHFPSE